MARRCHSTEEVIEVINTKVQKENKKDIPKATCISYINFSSTIQWYEIYVLSDNEFPPFCSFFYLNTEHSCFLNKPVSSEMDSEFFYDI